MKKRSSNSRYWFLLALACFLPLALLAFIAPEFLSTPNLDNRHAAPWQAFPFGTNSRGIPLWEFASQGARIVLLPSILSGLTVGLIAMVAGLVRCTGWAKIDTFLQFIGELLGSLPRLVVILIIALILPRDWRSLLPIGLAWALLAAPPAMDEAAATAGRLGGERFVEALKAHGFSGIRIYLYHVVWLNLRPILFRQAAEVTLQVVFLEIALSYLAVRKSQPSFTHSDSAHSWADLLYNGYAACVDFTFGLQMAWKNWTNIGNGHYGASRPADWTGPFFKVPADVAPYDYLWSHTIESLAVNNWQSVLLSIFMLGLMALFAYSVRRGVRAR